MTAMMAMAAAAAAAAAAASREAVPKAATLSNVQILIKMT